MHSLCLTHHAHVVDAASISFYCPATSRCSFFNHQINIIIMSTILIALIILFTAIFLSLAFIFINRRNEKKRNRSLLTLHSNAGSEKGLSFSSQELLRNKIIGLDGINKTLLVLEFLNGTNVMCLNMRDVTQCSVEKKYDSILVGNDRKGKMEPHLRSIDIKFFLKDNNAPVSVSFYDSNINSIYEMTELEAKARTWESVLSKMLSERSAVSV